MAIDLKSFDFKNIDLRNVYEWPLVGRLLLFFLACVAVFYLGYYFDFSNQSHQIFVRYKQELDLKDQVSSILKTKQEMQEIVLQYPELQKLLSQWQGQLINGSNLPDLLNQILKLGALNHLQFSLFAPGEKKTEDDYEVVPIKVVVQGGYNQVAHFISEIANLPQIVAVSDFIMGKQIAEPSTAEKAAGEGAASNNLTTAIMLEVYFLDNKK